MKILKQGKNQCGQSCVAMICNITLEEAIEDVGKKGLTRTKDLISALRLNDVECGDKLVRGFPESGSAILKFTHPCGKSHWVIWHKKKYYDPMAGVFRKVPNWLSESRVTSHLFVEIT